MTNHWVVELTFATVDPVHCDTLAALDEDGDAHDWYVSARPHAPGIIVAAYDSGDDPVTVSHTVTEKSQQWLDSHNVRGDIIEVRVVTEEQREAEASAATMPTLVSATGAAEILGVRRQRVHQLYKEHPRFPVPLVQLATGPVWDEKAIERFGSEWERKSGRPKSASKVASRKAGRGGTVRSMRDYRAAKSATTKPLKIAAKSGSKPANG